MKSSFISIAIVLMGLGMLLAPAAARAEAWQEAMHAAMVVDGHVQLDHPSKHCSTGDREKSAGGKCAAICLVQLSVARSDAATSLALTRDRFSVPLLETRGEGLRIKPFLDPPID